MSTSNDDNPQKKFAGLPYDFRKPTVNRAKSRMWNPDEPRMFPPKSYGWGLTINFYRVLHPFSRSS